MNRGQQILRAEKRINPLTAASGYAIIMLLIVTLGGISMDHIILGLLILSSRTIYQLRNRIDKGLNLMYSSSTGSIQAALKKLLDKGYIDCREIGGNGRNKKEYFITDAGRQEFDNWINSPIDCGGTKCPELSKIYFMGFSDPENRLENIREYINDLKTKYKALKLICDEAESFMHPDSCEKLNEQAKEIIFFQLAAARFGRDMMSFTVKWYEDFLNEMRGSNE